MRRSRIVTQVFSDASLSNAFTTVAPIIAMSTRPLYRGSRGRGRGGRSFSDRPYNDRERNQFVTGDSHFQSVHDANTGFRHSNRSSSSNVDPRRFNQNYSACPPPPFYQNQMSRPPPQQSFRQRPRSKPSDYREWEYAKTKPPPGSEKFVVLSYNILADYLANDHRGNLYYHIPRNMLSWGWRKSKIVFELGLWSADIMCLQEVDRFQDLEEEMKPRGYSGIWKMRTGNAVDGCAIFWRSNRFKLVYEESIQFNQLGLRDNVAQICVLETLLNSYTKEKEISPSESSAGSHRVVVCNIHVLYNPKRGDFKLGQVRTLLEKAHAVSKLWDDAPVVLCGDFNCTPKSHLYNFIVERKLDLSGLARDKVSGQDSAVIRPSRPELYTARVHNANKSLQGQLQPPDSTADVKNNSDMEVGKVSSGNTSGNINHAGNVDISNSVAEDLSLVTITDSETPHASNAKDSLTEELSVSTATEIKLDGLTLDEPVLSAKEEEGKLPSSEAFDYGKITYNPSSWTPMEIATATGDTEKTTAEHAMELKSTYSEVKGQENTRDENGEPVVTSYNRCFMGTVDYIWRTEGLQTVRVLAPIPKQAMQWTPGFPTPKWGSDHIALVSELVFSSNSKELPKS